MPTERITTDTALVVALAVALVLGAVGVVLALRRRRARARELAGLVDALARLGSGAAVADLPTSSTELAGLADAIAGASARLAEAADRRRVVDLSRREMQAWLAHDLRTPLAAISTLSAAIDDGLVPDPAAAHRRLRTLSGQLGDMIDDLFELTKIDSGTLRLRIEPVRLLDVVRDAVADVRRIAPDRDVQLVAPADADLVVMADARELARAIANLLANAAQHTPSRSPITVTTDLVDGRVSISVLDAGAGIHVDDLPRIFEPGWRAPRAADQGARASTGAGLGLAIVRGIARAHRGDVTVQNVPGGCRFDLLLPQGAAVAAA